MFMSNTHFGLEKINVIHLFHGSLHVNYLFGGQ